MPHFESSGLGGSRRPTLLGGDDDFSPLSPDEQRKVNNRLKGLVAEPLRKVMRDEEFGDFATRQFQRVFPGPLQRDASGKQIDNPPVRADFESFRPSVKRKELELAGPVGFEARNATRDVIGMKKGLANVGLFEFRVPDEKSDEANERFEDAIAAFQTAKGLTVDGLANPKGETIKALDATLFAPNDFRTRKVKPGEGPDLSRFAGAEPQRAESAAGADLAAPQNTARTVSADGLQESQTVEGNPVRPTPPGKEEELKKARKAFNDGAGRFDAALNILDKAKDPKTVQDQQTKALEQVTEASMALLSIADIFDDKKLLRSIGPTIRAAREATDSLEEGKAANMEDVVREWKKMLEALKELMTSRDA